MNNQARLSCSSSIQRRGGSSKSMKTSLLLLFTTFVVMWAAGLMFSGSPNENNMVNAQSLSSIFGTDDGDDFLTQLILGSALDDEGMSVNSDGTACVNQMDETDIDYYQSLIDSTSFYYLKLDSACEVVAIPANITTNTTTLNVTTTTTSNTSTTGTTTTDSLSTTTIDTTSTSDFSWMIADGYLFEKAATTFCNQASLEAQQQEDMYLKMLFSSSYESDLLSYVNLDDIISGLEPEYTLIDCSVPIVNVTSNATNSTSYASTSVDGMVSATTETATTQQDDGSLAWLIEPYLFGSDDATSSSSSGGDFEVKEFCDQASLDDQQLTDSLLRTALGGSDLGSFTELVDLSSILSGIGQIQYVLKDCTVPPTPIVNNSTNTTTPIVTLDIASPQEVGDSFDWFITGPYLFDAADDATSSSSNGGGLVKEFCDQASLDAQQFADSLLRMQLGNSDYQSMFTELVDISTITSTVEQIEYVLKDCTVPTIVSNVTNTTQIAPLEVASQEDDGDSFNWLITGPFLFEDDGDSTDSLVKEFCDQESLDNQQVYDALLRMQLGNSDYQSLFTDLVDTSSISGIEQIQYILKECTINQGNNTTNSTSTTSVEETLDSPQFDWTISGVYLFETLSDDAATEQQYVLCDQAAKETKEVDDLLYGLMLGVDANQLTTSLLTQDILTGETLFAEYHVHDCVTVQNSTTTTSETIDEEEQYDWWMSEPELFSTEPMQFCDEQSVIEQQASDLLYNMMFYGANAPELQPSQFNLRDLILEREEPQYTIKSCVTEPIALPSNKTIEWVIEKLNGSCVIGSEVKIVNCQMVDNATVHLSNNSFLNYSVTLMPNSYTVLVTVLPDSGYNNITQVVVSLFNTMIVTQLPNIYLITSSNDKILIGSHSNGDSLLSIALVVNGTNLKVFLSSNLVYNTDIFDTSNVGNILVGRSPSSPIYPFSGDLLSFSVLPSASNNLSAIFSAIASQYHPSISDASTQPTDVLWSITKEGNNCKIGQAIVQNCTTSSNSTLLLSNGSFVSLSLDEPLTDSFIVSVVVKPLSSNPVTQVLLDIGNDLKVVVRFPYVILIVNGVEYVVYTLPSDPNSITPMPVIVQFTDPGLSVLVNNQVGYQNSTIAQIPNSNNILIGRSDDLLHAYPFIGELSFFELLTNNVTNQTLSSIINTVSSVVSSTTNTPSPTATNTTTNTPSSNVTNTEIIWAITKDGSDCKIGQAVVKNCATASNSTLLLSNDSFISLNLSAPLTDSFIVSVVAKPLSTSPVTQVLLDVGDLKVILRYPDVILIVNGVETVIYTYPTTSNPRNLAATSFVVQFTDPGLSLFVDGNSKYQNPAISQIPNSDSILIGRSDDLLNVANVVSSTSPSNPAPVSNTTNTEVVWAITKDGSDCKIGQAVVKNCATGSNSTLMLSNESFISLNLSAPLTDSFIVSVVAKPSTTTSDPQVLLDVGTGLKVIIRYPHVILVLDGVETIIYTYPTTSNPSSPDANSFVVKFSDPGLSVFVDGNSKYQNPVISQIPNSDNILIGRSDDLLNAYPFNGELSFFELLTNNVNNQTLSNVISTVANVVSSTSPSNPAPRLFGQLLKDGSDCKIGQAVVKNCATASNSTLMLSNESFISLNLSAPLTDSFIVSVVAKPSTTTSDPQVLLDVGTGLKVIIRYPHVILVIDGVETVICTYPTTNPNNIDATSFVVQFTDPGLSVFVDGNSKYQNPAITQIPNSNNILIGRSDDLLNTYPFNGELSFFELLTNNVNNQTLVNVINNVQSITNSQDSSNNPDITWSVTKDGSDCKIGLAVVKNCTTTSSSSNSSLLLSSDSFVSLDLASPLTDNFVLSLVAKPSTTPTTSNPQVLLDIGTGLKVFLNSQNVSLSLLGSNTVIYSNSSLQSKPVSLLVEFTDPGLVVVMDSKVVYQDNTSSIPNSDNILIGRTNDLPNPYPFTGELVFFELLTSNTTQQTITSQMSVINNIVQTITQSYKSTNTSSSNNSTNNSNTNSNNNNNNNSSPSQEPPKIFCFGISQNSSLACSGNGNCISNNSCSCSENYVGLQCELPLCFGSVNCSNGICISPDTCKCNPGHTGSKCQYSTFADQCSGSFARAFGPTVTDEQLVYEMVLVDAKCGKTIVMQSQVLLDKVVIPENQTLQELVTTTKSPNGVMIMSFDPSLHKQQKDSLVFALISLQENSFNATVKTLTTLDTNQQPTSGLTLGQSKVLFNKEDQSFAITSETISNQAQLYSLDFDSNSAKLVNNLGTINTNTKFLLGGNIVFDPITNTSTYSFIVEDNNGKNVMATIPLTSTTITTPIETVNIPFTENTVFSMAVANTDTKEQFLINVGTNGTEIVGVIPSLKAENVTFISLDTDGDFSVSNVENLIIDTQNNKITLTNTEDSTSISVELTRISTVDPFQGVSKMIASTESSFSFVAETTPVYSVDIKKFSKLYLPVSGGTTITFEGNLDVSFKPTLGIYLIFSVDNVFTQRLSIQKTSTNGVYQVNTKEMKNLPSQLADLNSFQVNAKVEIVDFKSSSAEPLLEVPYTGNQFTVYSNRINNVSPVLGYIGNDIVINDVFVPEHTAFVKLSNKDESIDVNVDAQKVSSSSIKFKMPQLNIETVLLDLQLSIESGVYSSTTQTRFRYVSPSVQEESASSIFSTSTTSVDVETVAALPQAAGIPLITKIDLPKSRDGSAMVFKPTINSSLCSEMPVLRQYVSSSKKFDISKIISFKIILPSKFTSGNLFEVWFTKVDHLFISLSYDATGRRIHVNDTEISDPCTYDLGETYEFRLTYADQKYTVKLVHDVMGTVCDATYKTTLNDFTNYTMSVGQAFNCKNLTTTQIDSLTSFALYDVAEKTTPLLANIRTEPLDVLAIALGIPLFLVGLIGAFFAVGVIAWLWRRYRRKNKFGKFVYYNETNADRERTIADLFEKISSEPSSSENPTETEGFADLDDLSYGTINNSFNTWV
ncbi:predicted protein [Naegleria gruberi]|uniref:Predicted protein n=1 Tax=Naegleria gruberi TaxID=5762 RepID=D2UZ30_NAEGR|nr:uncharacterized protein NAEGRDRAFT_61792 [Naegleria gruberi]EFC50080.1 predicted protein [Naegleria gruberi]|eukprot:XP_002682824.1 predicted protein [Naegleria gruberi strain NEG-M]